MGDCTISGCCDEFSPAERHTFRCHARNCDASTTDPFCDRVRAGWASVTLTEYEDGWFCHIHAPALIAVADAMGDFDE